jgi:hypothetical protein
MQGGTVLHASEHSENMYSSIDIISHRVSRLLKKYHERIINKNQNAKFEQKLHAGFEEIEEIDPLVELDEKYSESAEVQFYQIY